MKILFKDSPLRGFRPNNQSMAHRGRHIFTFTGKKRYLYPIHSSAACSGVPHTFSVSLVSLPLHFRGRGMSFSWLVEDDGGCTVQWSIQVSHFLLSFVQLDGTYWLSKDAVTWGKYSSLVVDATRSSGTTSLHLPIADVTCDNIFTWSQTLFKETKSGSWNSRPPHHHHDNFRRYSLCWDSSKGRKLWSFR